MRPALAVPLAVVDGALLMGRDASGAELWLQSKLSLDHCEGARPTGRGGFQPRLTSLLR